MVSLVNAELAEVILIMLLGSIFSVSGYVEVANNWPKPIGIIC
jgi:hypothetical protein